MKVKDHFLTGETFEIVPSSIEGILETSPRPTDLERFYQSEKYISHHQDSSSIKHKIYKYFQGININYKRNILAAYIPRNASVLDYGAGAGDFISALENDFQTLAFEPSSSTALILKEKLKKTEIISALDDVADDSLDAITLWHVLEHIENQGYILQEFCNKLKANGLLVIAVPNFNSYDAKHYGEFWAAYDVPRHLYHYSQKGLQSLLEKNGFKMEATKPLHLDAYYISALSAKYKKNAFWWLSGTFRGAISNFKAVKTGEFSSMIYLLRKK